MINTVGYSIVQESKTSNIQLDFDNERSKEMRQLATENLECAKRLFEIAENSDPQYKKAIYRKTTQSAMESVEASQKSIVYADLNAKNIKDPSGELHEKLTKTHNLNFLQKETQKAGINILDSSDIKSLSNGITLIDGDKSRYNAIRYKSQDIKRQEASDSIKTAEKSIANYDRKVLEQNIEIFLK